jgi:oligoribonuclease
METARHEFIWIDLETTGLDPTTGLLLEFAAVLCRDGRGGDFGIEHAYTGAVHHTDAAQHPSVSQYVRDMHTKNGLWDAVDASDVSVFEADDFLAGLAHALSAGRPRSITLAGSSVHFDLAWARVHLPKFAWYLHHRVFDVSTIRRAVDSWGSGAEWPTREAHRAMDDVQATILEARIAREALCG